VSSCHAPRAAQRKTLHVAPPRGSRVPIQPADSCASLSRADPDAAAMFEAFRSAVAENMGVDPSMVQLTGVHTDGDSEIGCGGGTSVGGGFSLNVDDTYINSLGTSDALSDCLIDASEMASDPDAAAMAQAIIEAQAAALGVDPSTISITGVHTDGDPAPGCQGTGRRVLTFEGSHS
jgi:hypothetical protein